MGYILPVQQHTYKDYQRRIQPENVSPYAIQRPYPVFMKKVEDNQSPYPQFNYNQFQENSQKKQAKGQHINMYI